MCIFIHMALRLAVCICHHVIVFIFNGLAQPVMIL